MIDAKERDDSLRNEQIIAEDVSFEDYLRRFEGERTEWLSGKVIALMSNNMTHQLILAFLTHLFGAYLGKTRLGKLFLAGYPMLMASSQIAREPDLMVVLNDHLDHATETYLDGAADLVVEVVSPESGKRDRGDKFIEYEAAGVPEYLLLDPIREEASLYQLGENGYYRVQMIDSEGRLVSNVLPGFVLKPEWLWRDPLPDWDTMMSLVEAMVSD